MSGCRKVDAGFWGKARLCLQGSIRLVVGGLLLSGLTARAAEADKDKVQAIAIKPVDPTAALKVSYYRDVRPLLANHCIECHGADEPKGDYRMTSVAELLKSGKKQGLGIIPGKPDESPVVRYIRGELKPQMPKGNPVLTAEALHTIRLWIAAGAVDDTAEATASNKEELAAWEQFDPRKAETIAKAQLTVAEREALLNPGADLEKRFLARRQWRLSQLPPAPTPPSVKAQTFNPVDNFIVAKWQEKGLLEAQQNLPLSDDEAFVRRAYLDIIGELPTVPEVFQFLKDTSTDRRARLIANLLSRDIDYSIHWTTFWEDIVASADADIRGGILTRGNYKLWLNFSLRRNKPLDLLVAELIDTTLPGAKQPVEQKSFDQVFKVGYIRNDSVPVTLETAANIGQVFLGTSMKCASCHTHFDNPEWPQAKFIAFASIFSDKDLELVRCEKKTGTMIGPAFPFVLPGAPAALPRDREERLRRTAQLVTDPLNPRFAKAFVNRIWKRCFGLGLVEPVDEFREDRKGSHPELLDWLAKEFIRSGYDLHFLLKTILTSRTYQLAYNPALADKFDLSHPDALRYFRSPQLRRMTAEQFLDSLDIVGTQQHVPPRRQLFRKEVSSLASSLGRPASRNEVITTRPEETAAIQFLEMLNGSEYQTKIYRSPLLDLLSPLENAAATVESFYLAVLNRRPDAATQKELVNWLQPILQQSPYSKQTGKEVLFFGDELAGTLRPMNGTEYIPLAWGTKDIQPVFAGEYSLRTAGDDKVQWQGAELPPNLAVVNVDDILVAQVQLDPKNPPKAIFLRVLQEEVNHQVFWSSQALNRMNDTSLVQINGGPLPSAGAWVKLQIPLKAMQMVNGPIKSISIGTMGGVAYWDDIGVTKVQRSGRILPLGDLLWALVSNPEFQYIR